MRVTSAKTPLIFLLILITCTSHTETVLFLTSFKLYIILTSFHQLFRPFLEATPSWSNTQRSRMSGETGPYNQNFSESGDGINFDDWMVYEGKSGFHLALYPFSCRVSSTHKHAYGCQRWWRKITDYGSVLTESDMYFRCTWHYSEWS